MIYILDSESRILGSYNDEEIDAIGIDTIAQRDFPFYKSATNNGEDKSYAEENDLGVESWIATLLDILQENNMSASLKEGIITVYGPNYIPLARFMNWGEVEYWLQENFD